MFCALPDITALKVLRPQHQAMMSRETHVLLAITVLLELLHQHSLRVLAELITPMLALQVWEIVRHVLLARIATRRACRRPPVFAQPAIIVNEVSTLPRHLKVTITLELELCVRLVTLAQLVHRLPHHVSLVHSSIKPVRRNVRPAQ
jgi:hypothetical protein